MITVLALDQAQIKENATSDRILWRFNPLGGSHHGGLFESAKKALPARTTRTTSRSRYRVQPKKAMAFRSRSHFQMLEEMDERISVNTEHPQQMG